MAGTATDAIGQNRTTTAESSRAVNQTDMPPADTVGQIRTPTDQPQTVSEGGRGQADDQEQITDQEASEPRPRATFEQRYERLSKAVTRQPLNREAMVAILSYCVQTHACHDVEQHVLSLPAAQDILQSPYGLMDQLVTAGGLERTEVDEQGVPVLPEDKEGLTEDEVDDLVADEVFTTTDVGVEVASYFSPDRRMARLLDIHPQAAPAFADLMSYCEQPHTRVELESYIRSKSLLSSMGSDAQLRPSVMLDKLEAAGMLEWRQHAWRLSDAGRRYIQGEGSAA